MIQPFSSISNIESIPKPMGFKPMTVSVVVCNFNYEAFVAEAIESALSQSLKPLEVILIDDGSTDNSLDQIKSFIDNKLFHYHEKVNGGQISAYNVGLELAKGEIVVFLDSDDLLLPSALENVVDAFQDESVVKAHWYLRLIDKFSIPIDASIPSVLDEGNLQEKLIDFGILYNSAPGSGNAYRRSALKRLFPLPVDDFDKHGADFFTNYGISLLGRICKIDKTLGAYRVHAIGEDSRNSLAFGNAAKHANEPARTRMRVSRFQNWIGERLQLSFKESAFIDFSMLKSEYSLVVMGCVWGAERVRAAKRIFPRFIAGVHSRRDFRLYSRAMLYLWALLLPIAPTFIANVVAAWASNPSARPKWLQRRVSTWGEVFINGRFLSRQPTGVDRFAIETLRAMDAYLSEQPAYARLPITLLVPPSKQLRSLDLLHIQIRTLGRFTGVLWEQLELPWFTRGKLLISLCNAAPAFKRKQIVVIHDAAPSRVPESYSLGFRIWYRLLMPWLGSVAQKIFTVSEFSRKELSLAYGIRLEKITVLPESGEHIKRFQSDHSILDRYELRGRPFVLGVSSMSPHKNFTTLIQAVELLGSDCKFDVVIAGGTNPLIFTKTDLPSYVKHVGYVTDAELRALYEHAACFVFPSYYEGFGLPAAEAMTLGCPVIAANAAAIPEVCGEAAIYFESLESGQLASILQSVLSSSEKMVTLRQRSLDQASKWQWRTTARILLAVLFKGKNY